MEFVDVEPEVQESALTSMADAVAEETAAEAEIAGA